MIDFEADAAGEPLPEDRLERLAVLAQRLRQAQFDVARIDGELAAAEARERKLREETIPDLMVECQLTQIKLADGSVLTIADDLQCGVSEERRAAAYGWLRANNLDGIIKTAVVVPFGRGSQDEVEALAGYLTDKGIDFEEKEDVHWQTLKSTLKEEIAKRGKNPELPQVPVEPFAIRQYKTTKMTPPPGVPAPPKPRPKKK